MAKFTPRRNSRPDQTFQVQKTAPLLQYLIELWSDRSRTTIKSYLSHRQIAVNGKVETAFDLKLRPGDTITLSAVGERRQNPNHKVRIVYEDRDLMVVDKKNGLLTASKNPDEQTALTVMTDHVQHYGQNNRLFLVHYLDRDISGLLLFAKTEEIQKILQRNWNNNTIRRTYIAVVEGAIQPEKGTIESWLTENARTMKMETSERDNGGTKAVTHYKTLKNNGLYSLVELEMETTHKHQARVQLASIGHPIAGDKKYGAQSNPLGRLCLHAQKLSFLHPATGDRLNFDTDIPAIFR